MSFDANMRYFPRGCRFRAEAYGLSRDSELFARGVRKGQLIECRLPVEQPQTDEHDASVIAEVFLPDGNTVLVSDKTDVSTEWLVYQHAIQIPGMNAMTTAYLDSVGVRYDQ